MSNYKLTDQEENDFRFANGKSFEAWLAESMPVWAEAAKANRKTALSRAISGMSDELVQQFVETATITTLL